MNNDQAIAIIAAILHTGARIRQTIDEAHGVTWHNDPEISESLDTAREILAAAVPQPEHPTR